MPSRFTKVLVFVNRTDDVEKVVELLKRAGITAEGFSARLDQAERKKRLDQIKSDDQKVISWNVFKILTIIVTSSCCDLSKRRLRG